MRLLITAATQDEIQLFSPKEEHTDVLITGVGIPATLYHLQKRLQQLDYDMIVQAGFAGSFSDELKPGEIVLVREDCFGDLGAEEQDNYSTVFDMGFAGKDEFPFTNGWLLNSNKWLEQLPFKKVKAVSVNKVSDSPSLKAQREKSFDPGIETMEGAALHYVCLQENIPFLQLRVISNMVGVRDKTKWKMKESVENLAGALVMLVSKISG